MLGRWSARKRFVAGALLAAGILARTASTSRPPRLVAPSTQARALRSEWPQGEGTLGNDVFLPTSERATAALAEGDLALSGEPPDRIAAFDAWRRALSESRVGDCVPAPRGTESVERAVLRRLSGGGEDLAAAWRERFERPSELERSAAQSDASALERVERDWPMTRAAARAALALGDRSWEAGEEGAAAIQLARARAHADPEDRELASAIERRASALHAGPGVAPVPGEEGWRGATRLEFEAEIPLVSSDEPRKGIRPGIAFLGDGRVCIQGADTLHLVATDGKARSFPLLALVREFGWTWIPPFVEEGGTWLLRPATSTAAGGGRVALLAGRGARTRGNALICLETNSGLGEPFVSWGYFDGGFRGEVAGARTMAATLGPGLWEFEPGPLFLGRALYVQARQWKAEGDAPATIDESAVNAWCLAFDPETGLLLWKTLLAVGPSAKVRLWGERGIARPADPLAVADGFLFAGTGIGAGVFLDPTDGRAEWSIKIRRAPEGAARWKSCAPISIAPDSIAEEGRGGRPWLLWTPSDSDRLYSLLADSLGRSQEPFVYLPQEIGTHLEAIGAVADRVFLVSRSGDREALSSVSLASGARSTSVELPRGGNFTVGGRVSPSRAIVASDRAVHLFDLTRDLYLLDAVALPKSDVDPAQGMATRGDRVYVASERMLWILKAR